MFNYDLPEHDEVYVHRVGRTGRIGKRGTAVSLVRGKYLSHLTTLKKAYKVPFEEIMLPDEKEILWMQAERLAVQILEDASGVEMEQYRPVADALLSRGDVKEILAYLLRTHYAQQPRRPEREGSDEGGEQREARPPRPPRERSERPRREERRPQQDGHDEGADAAGEGGEGDDVSPLSAATNLYVTLGQHNGITDILGLAKYLGELSGVDAAHFTGAGAVRDHSSHIEVDTEVADKVIAGVNGKPKPGVLASDTAEARAPAVDPLAPVESAGDGDGDSKPQHTTILCERAKSQPGQRRPFRGGGGGGGGRGRGGDRGDRRPRRR